MNWWGGSTELIEAKKIVKETQQNIELSIIRLIFSFAMDWYIWVLKDKYARQNVSALRWFHHRWGVMQVLLAKPICIFIKFCQQQHYWQSDN